MNIRKKGSLASVISLNEHHLSDDNRVEGSTAKKLLRRNKQLGDD
jgi:hypothetical protein